MSIIVDEIKGTRRGGWSADGGRSYSLAVRVQTGDPTIGVRAALRSVGVDAGAYYRFPLAGAATEWDYGVWLNSIEATDEDEDGKSWIVSLGYKQVDWAGQAGGSGGGSDAAGFVANPLNIPPSVRWSSESEELACTHDRNGNPIRNSAGDPFDPPLAIPVSTPVATVTRNLATFDPTWIDAFKDHVNSTAWMGFPANTVLCKDIGADRQYDADFGYYWAVTYEFAFRPIWVDGSIIIQPGWSTQVLSAGLRQLVGGAVKQILIDGAPTSSPVALKSDGSWDPAADPVYLTFDLLPEVDLAGLDLPSDLFSVATLGSPVGGS